MSQKISTVKKGTKNTIKRIVSKNISSIRERLKSNKIRVNSKHNLRKLSIIFLTVMTIVSSAFIYVGYNYKIGEFSLVDEFMIQRVEYTGMIGKIVKIETPKNIPKFLTVTEAVSYVQSIEYNLFIDSPVEVLSSKKGNCLGKARLLYFIGKENNYDFTILKDKDRNHIKVSYNNIIYDL